MKKFLGVVFGGVSITFVGAMFSFMQKGESTNAALELLFAAVFGFLAYKLFTAAGVTEEQKAQYRENQRQMLKTCNLVHVGGLPLAEDSVCRCTAEDSEFTFASGAARFTLEKSKITDMKLKTKSELQQQYVSSAGGAIAGGILFGPVGAILGGRVKKKTVKNDTRQYFLITYDGDGELKLLAFMVDYHSIKSVQSYIQDFRSASHQIKEYKL